MGAYATLLLGVNVAAGGVESLSSLPPITGQLLGAVTLTAPATIALAAAEATGGTPGKRMVGLRVTGADGQPLTFASALVRTAAKVALPWELAHLGVWHFVVHGGGAVALTSTVAAYLVLGTAGAAVISNRRPWYEHLRDTSVVSS